MGRKKVIKNDEDLSEGLPTPDHLDNPNDIPEGTIYAEEPKKPKRRYVRKVQPIYRTKKDKE